MYSGGPFAFIPFMIVVCTFFLMKDVVYEKIKLKRFQKDYAAKTSEQRQEDNYQTMLKIHGKAEADKFYGR